MRLALIIDTDAATDAHSLAHAPAMAAVDTQTLAELYNRL